MAEVGISVASKLAENLVSPALREGQYLFCVGEVRRSLQVEKDKLILRQGTIQKCIEEARKKIEEIDEAVNKWMNDVQEVIAKVEDLQQQLNANKGYFRGWCPSWKRYCLCRELAKKIKTMEQLRKESEFKPLSYPVSLPEIEYLSSKNFIYFKSTKEAEDKLLQALKDDNCYIIGLYGMGGSGKTSLSIEVGNKAKKLKIFDHVIFIVVSQEPQINKIQKEIAESLELKFEEESDSRRAKRLSMRMNSGERILIILDDVWARLDFKTIGIPIEGDHQKGCKVLLTTRLQQVCTSMDCNPMIPLHLLSEEESWTLLKMNARINGGFSSDTMNKVAREVVKECKGLPIAIAAVGTSLKGKSDNEWKVALNNLRHSKPLDVEPGVRDAFTCLKLSYDYLRNDTAKSILLMCSIFPEDHEIEVEDLFRYGIGLGICKQVDSFDTARSKVNMAIRDLIDSCLLSYSGQGNKNLKMHDLVRDVAVWIVSKEKGTILINQGRNQLELLKHDAVKDSFAVSSWDLKENWFPAELNAPKLEVLLLNYTFYPPPLDWSNVPFEGVKELKVMAVIGDHTWWLQILSLPQSTQWLTNLRTLRLLKLELKDISFVVSLRRLEILDLKNSKFKELPNDIGKLNKLKLLDLSWCQIEECCDEVIRRCSQLEELYIYGEVCINSYVTLEKNENFMKLQSYVISVLVPKLQGYERRNLPKRVMYMAEFNMSMPGKVVRNLLQRADTILLYKLKGGCKSIIPEMSVGSMNELTELRLIDCDEMECLVNQVFPGGRNFCNLKRLAIKQCPNLTSLFPMSVARNLLRLEEIELSSCGLLKHMITKEESGNNSGQEILPVIDKDLEVADNSNLLLPQDDRENCSSSLNLFPLLKSLILEDLPCFLKISHENDYLSWSCEKKQQWKLQSSDARTPQLFILGLQHLQILVSRECGKVKHVFSMEVLPCLTYLLIDGCDGLEEIIYEDEEPHNISNAKVCFPNLETLEVSNCNKLKRLFSSTIARMLPQLQSLTIRNAAQLEEVFWHKTKDSKEKIELPNLRDITLSKLLVLVDICQGIKLHAVKLDDFEISGCPKFAPVSEYFQMAVEGYDDQVISDSSARRLELSDLINLIYLWKGPTLISFKSLEALYVRGCSKLKTIFSAAVIKSLPQLGVLDVYDCEELEEIISDEESKEPSNPHTQHVCFPKLRYLEIKRCNKLKSVFPMSMAGDLPQLEWMEIKECSKLEFIFGSSAYKAHDPEGIQWKYLLEMHIKFLPNLRCLELVRLPNLVDIFCTRFHIQSLTQDFVVEYCPNFSSTTITTLHNLMKKAKKKKSNERLYRKTPGESVHI